MTTVVAFAIVALVMLIVVAIIMAGAAMLTMPFVALAAIIIRFIKGPPV